MDDVENDLLDVLRLAGSDHHVVSLLPGVIQFCAERRMRQNSYYHLRRRVFELGVIGLLLELEELIGGFFHLVSKR
jgi:hypothetical protein